MIKIDKVTPGPIAMHAVSNSVPSINILERLVRHVAVHELRHAHTVTKQVFFSSLIARQTPARKSGKFIASVEN